MRAIAEEAFAHGARIQGLAFRRAWRRPRALRIPRGDVRRAPGARLRGGEGQLRSAAAVQSRQDRACAEIRRPQPVPLRPRLSRRGRSTTALDWSAYPGAGGGFQGAVEMCNNNGACRKLARRRHVPELSRHAATSATSRAAAPTRCGSPSPASSGRTRSTSDEMAETMKLCVSCKACRRECPTGVDMARMKIEVLAARGRKTRPVAARPAGRLSAALCALCGAARLGCSTCATVVPGAANLSETVAGFSARGAACRCGGADYFNATRRWRGYGPGVTARTRSRAVRRHLQPLFRARKSRRGAQAC